MVDNSSLMPFHGRNAVMSSEDLSRARESRAAEALKMKDEQISILTQQTSSLSDALNKVSSILSIYHII